MNELEKIDSYTYSVLVSLLLKMVPEYKVIFDEKYSESNLPDEGVYLFMNEFASCLSGEIKTNLSSNFVKNAFNYINTIGESNNLELLNILKVGILEMLYTERGVDRNSVAENLSKKLKISFWSFSKYYK